jgi:hypothetical protein
MSEHPISGLPVSEFADMPDDIREMIEVVQEKSGCIPSVLLALAHRPPSSVRSLLPMTR